jgi:hypothetical protein
MALKTILTFFLFFYNYFCINILSEQGKTEIPKEAFDLCDFAGDITLVK